VVNRSFSWSGPQCSFLPLSFFSSPPRQLFSVFFWQGPSSSDSRNYVSHRPFSDTDSFYYFFFLFTFFFGFFLAGLCVLAVVSATSKKKLFPYCSFRPFDPARQGVFFGFFSHDGLSVQLYKGCCGFLLTFDFLPTCFPQLSFSVSLMVFRASFLRVLSFFWNECHPCPTAHKLSLRFRSLPEPLFQFFLSG